MTFKILAQKSSFWAPKTDPKSITWDPKNQIFAWISPPFWHLLVRFLAPFWLQKAPKRPPKWPPKQQQNGTQWQPKCIESATQVANLHWRPSFCDPKHAQNDAKMSRKRAQNACQRTYFAHHWTMFLSSFCALLEHIFCTFCAPLGPPKIIIWPLWHNGFFLTVFLELFFFIVIKNNFSSQIPEFARSKT